MDISETIKEKAIELGFDAVGITDASAIDTEDVEHLKDWLDSGFAGSMAYMRRNREKRINPSKLLKNAVSVIVCALNYKHPNHAGQLHKPTLNPPTVAQYACYEDYHLFMKKLLLKLADFIKSTIKTDPKFKVCVDSAPLAERAIAKRAGLGFIGKNHMLINPDIGPAILLAEIITDLPLTKDEKIDMACNNCDLCKKACPAGALREDGRFNAERCISYLTTEYKGKIPPEFPIYSNFTLLGCDRCLAVCPYFKNAPACKNPNFQFHPEWHYFEPKKILDMPQQNFKNTFADSALERAGLERLKRNAKICLSNAKQAKV